MAHPIKLIISYNMRPGKEEACHQYIVQDVGVVLNKHGFRFTEAWYTAWGSGPQIMGCGLLESADVARELLNSEAWKKSISGLQRYVTDFSVRAIEPAASFQI